MKLFLPKPIKTAIKQIDEVKSAIDVRYDSFTKDITHFAQRRADLKTGPAANLPYEQITIRAKEIFGIESDRELEIVFKQMGKDKTISKSLTQPEKAWADFQMEFFTKHFKAIEYIIRMFYGISVPSDGTRLNLAFDCLRNLNNNPQVGKFCENYGILCVPEKYVNLSPSSNDWNACFDLVRKVARDTILKTSHQQILEELNEYSTRGVTVLFMLSACKICLGSGHYHIYRGVLNPVGMTLALIHHLLVQEALAKAYINDDKAIEIIKGAKYDIFAVG